MNKSKIYGRPFFENGKIFYPYLNMESRRSFAFYANYRYLTDSISPNKCPVGAVFNIDLQGKIIHRWVDEICE